MKPDNVPLGWNAENSFQPDQASVNQGSSLDAKGCRSGNPRTDEYAYQKALAILRVWQLNALSRSLPNDGLSQKLRARLFRWAGADIGERVRIGQGVFVIQRHLPNLRIADDSFVNCGCLLDLNARITIGSGVALGTRVSLITCTHELGPPAQRAGELVRASIIIEDGVWVGAGAVILPGVTIGSGSVVAAGAVINQSVSANMLVGGVPARPIRPL